MQLMENPGMPGSRARFQRMNQLFNEGSPPFAAPPVGAAAAAPLQALSEQSEGLFNPALGHLTRAWGFQGAMPTACVHPAGPYRPGRRDHPSMRDITIDGFRVSASKPTVKLDFRAIQKGFAVDQAIARLQDLGINNASISADGNVRAIGSRDGHPWSDPGARPAAAVSSPQCRSRATKLRSRRVTTPGTSPGTARLTTTSSIRVQAIPAKETASVTVLHPTHPRRRCGGQCTVCRRAERLAPDCAEDGNPRCVMLTDHQGRLHESGDAGAC